MPTPRARKILQEKNAKEMADLASVKFDNTRSTIPVAKAFTNKDLETLGTRMAVDSVGKEMAATQRTSDLKIKDITQKFADYSSSTFDKLNKDYVKLKSIADLKDFYKKHSKDPDFQKQLNKYLANL